MRNHQHVSARPSSTDYKSELVARGIRSSSQRIKVLEYLHRVGGHPTADEIYTALSGEVPSLVKATVYNILNAFVEAGLVRTLSVNGLEKRYDITLHDHGHFTCDRCGRIYNFEINIRDLKTTELDGFQIRWKNVYFNGLCPTCRKLEQKKKE